MNILQLKSLQAVYNAL